jgi:hypothetical protein
MMRGWKKYLMAEIDPPPVPSFGEALRFWSKLGWISFGGPAGQIAMMHKEIVERRRWLSEDHFLHALNFCMLLPGPEAHSWRRISAGACTALAAGSRRECCSCCHPFSFC